MSIGEELDRLAAEGRLSSVTLARRYGGGWQCYLKLGLVDSYVAQIDETPTTALTKAVEKLPSCEVYDLKFGAQAVTERAKADHPLSDRAMVGTWLEVRGLELRSEGPAVEPAEKGIFD